MPVNFAYPQAIPNPQQMNFRPPRPRKLAMKQARPFTPPLPFDYDGPEPSIDDILEQAQINEEVPPLPEPKAEEIKKPVIPTSFAIADLIALLGCRDKDPIICSQVGEESCRARPGFYLKLCPVKCKNCNGLVCMDSNKIDCQEMQKRGGCRLAVAAEYCPKTCNKCPTPSFIAEQQSPCRDELDTCEQLAESGVCEHPLSRVTLRSYCAKSCGFCKTSQYYLNEFSEYANQNRQPKSKRRPFLNKFFV